ncbi:hypothetical protein ENBRE01_0553 [Enteropsectra breve]|nr:hypothetical protein ENBRE01_0553 [Enteropsectra breve]
MEGLIQLVGANYRPCYVRNYEEWMPKLRQVNETIEYSSAIKCSLEEAYNMLNKKQENAFEIHADSQGEISSLTPFERFSHMILQMFLTIEDVRQDHEDEPEYEDYMDFMVGMPPRYYFVQGTSLEEKLAEEDDLSIIMQNHLNKHGIDSRVKNSVEMVQDVANSIEDYLKEHYSWGNNIFVLRCDWTSKCTRNGELTIEKCRIERANAFPLFFSMNKGTPVNDLWRCTQTGNNETNPDGTNVCILCHESGAGCSNVLRNFDVKGAVIFRYVFSEENGEISDPPRKFLLNSKNKVLVLKSILLRPTEHYDGYLLVIFKNLPTFEYIIYDGKDYYDIQDWTKGDISKALCTTAEFLVYDFPRRELDYYPTY